MLDNSSKSLVHFVKQGLLNQIPGHVRGFGGGATDITGNAHKVFKRLYDGYIRTERLWKNVRIQEIQRTSEYQSVSDYIPHSIRKVIVQHLKLHRVFQMGIGNRVLRFHIVYSEAHPLSNSGIMEMIYRMYLWLTVVFRVANEGCAQELDVFIYLTENQKRLPVRNTIDREHVNTAFTMSCKPVNTIHIFRHEEWFKVFIHESFHCFGLDFSGAGLLAAQGDMRIKRRFGLRSDIDLRIYETYTEMWAVIMHTFIQGFLKGGPRKTWATVWKSFDTSLKHEQAFSMFQCCKILAHNKLSYTNVCTGNMTRYNEKSHAFSYYILKSALLFFPGEFIQWCMGHNIGDVKGFGFVAFRNTDATLNSFVELLIGQCCREEYLERISVIEDLFLAYRKSHRDADILQTLRMTVYG
jgi:hypothetical protein